MGFIHIGSPSHPCRFPVISIIDTKRAICFIFGMLLVFSSNVSLHRPILFMKYSLRSRDKGLVFKSAGFSFVEILSTRNHLLLIACWLHIILVEKCFARPGPRRLKKLCALVESSLSRIWTLELLLKPPASPSRNWSSCFSWIPSTIKLVAAKISASIEDNAVEASARLWLCTQQEFTKIKPEDVDLRVVLQLAQLLSL